MRIEVLTADLTKAYDEFLLSDERTLLYQSSRYMTFLEELLTCKQRTLVALDQKNQIVGVLPLMSQDGSFGAIINSLPYYGSNGGILAESKDVQKVLLDAYCELSNAQEVAASTLIENPLLEVDYSSLHEDIQDQRIGQFTSIKHSQNHANSLMDQFHYKTRNMIRKAAKLGVTVQIENDQIDFLAKVHKENMSEIGGLAKSHDFFNLLSKHYRPNHDFRIYVARLDGQPIAATLVFYFNRTAEYYTPVILKEFRDTQALSATIHTAMTDASKEGFVWWNWGGTWLTQDGVYRFKSRWGTQDMPYRYFIKVNNQKLLKASRHDLLTSYPSFFTVPFSALQE